MPLYTSVSRGSIADRRRSTGSRPMHELQPVAITRMSAGSVSPELTRTPVSVNASIVSVTTVTLPAEIA